MKNMINNSYEEQIVGFLHNRGLADKNGTIAVTALAGDGSSRIFFIITTETASYCGVFPGADNPQKGMAEAHAAFRIGSHLKKRGLPVPEIHGFDPDSGFLLFEDLGRTLLHDLLQERQQAPEAKDGRKTLALYKEIVETLLYMQISGSVRFDRKWCWDTQRYDKKLMLERESGYFMQAFCRDLLAMQKFPAGLDGEFKALAGRAARQPAIYFLHRDFQSRNIMITGGDFKFIDFQGGRLGPLGYDLASLLIDPYAQLPEDLQQELMEHYLEHLCRYGLDDQAFLNGYPSLALQRNLQVLGAFAFLGFQKDKKFFRQFIEPAASSLHKRLAQSDGGDYPKLRRLSETILALLEQKKPFFSGAVE